jgi:hypothetical protein
MYLLLRYNFTFPPCPQNSLTQQTLKSHYHTMNFKYVPAPCVLNILESENSPWHSTLLTTQVLRLQYQKEQAQAHITVQTKFNYAWGLVKSPMRENQVEGVRLLQGE